MTPCPSCHQPVEILDKHLGTLFTCPHCNAVSFINFDGQPELANHEADAELPLSEGLPEDPVFEASPFSNQGNFSAETNYAIEPNASSEVSSSEENAFQPAQEFSTSENDFPNQEYAQAVGDADQAQSDFQNQAFNPDQSLEQNNYSVEQDSAYNDPEPPPLVEEAPFDFNRTLDQVPAEAPPPSSVADNADFSDVTSFANADTGAGPLSYVVVIDGIESSQLLYQLKEAMTDSRFGWDVLDLLNQVGGGRLIIAGLNPAKASILISRIKYLPFKISWRQDVLSSS